MLLADTSIRERIERGSIAIIPYDVRLQRPSSVCLTLDSRIIEVEWPSRIEIGDEATYPTAKGVLDVAGSGYGLRPGHFVLASSYERISVDTTLAGILFDISGLARLGLDVCCSSLISPGFGSKRASTITLEVFNRSRSTIVLIPGMRICHLAFVALDTISARNYDSDVGLYSEASGPKLSAFFRNWRH